MKSSCSRFSDKDDEGEDGEIKKKEDLGFEENF